jgi:hypothetical protein
MAIMHPKLPPQVQQALTTINLFIDGCRGSKDQEIANALYVLDAELGEMQQRAREMRVAIRANPLKGSQG